MTENLIRQFQQRYASGSLRPNELDETGLSLMHQAAAGGQLTCLKLLVKFGGDPRNRTNDGAGPAHFATGNGHLQILQFLHDCVRDSISVKDSHDVTPLYIAAQEGQLDCLIWLIKTSATPPDIKTSNGMTPSHVATQEGKLECLRYLLKAAHASSNCKDNGGRPLLHYGAAEGHWKVVRWLVEHCEADVEEGDHNNMTALHVAAMCGQNETIEALVKCGASPTCQDKQGKTPLDYSNKYGNKKSAALLKKILTHAMTARANKRVRFNDMVATFDSNKKNPYLADDLLSQLDSWSAASPKRKTNTMQLYKGKTRKLLDDDVKQPDLIKDIELKANRLEPTNYHEARRLSANEKSNSPRSINMQPTNHIVARSLSANEKNNSPRSITTQPTNHIVARSLSANVRSISPRSIPDYDENSSIHSHRIFGSGYSESMETKPVNRRVLSPLPLQPNQVTQKTKNKTYSSSGFSTSSPKNAKRYGLSNEEVNSQTRSSPRIQINKNTEAKLDSINLQTAKQPNGPAFQSPVGAIPPKAPIRRSLMNKERKTYVVTSQRPPLRSPSQMSTTTTNMNFYPNGRVSYDATQYVPRSYYARRGLGSTRGLQALKMERSLSRAASNVSSKLAVLDLTPRKDKQKTEFYSNNLHSRGSTWSVIRDGIYSLFTHRHKKNEDHPVTWSGSRGRFPRDDIFSRFSIPNKSTKKEFHDLFNSSAEGVYTSHTNNAFFTGGNFLTTATTAQHNKLTSLQSGYDESDLSRLKARALDTSLRGKGKMESDLNYGPISTGSNDDTAQINAFIW